MRGWRDLMTRFTLGFRLPSRKDTFLSFPRSCVGMHMEVNNEQKPIRNDRVSTSSCFYLKTLHSMTLMHSKLKQRNADPGSSRCVSALCVRFIFVMHTHQR